MSAEQNIMSVLFSGGMDALAANPLDWYREMREHQPLRYRSQYDLWDVFCYDDVLRVLNDHSTFSSAIVRIERQTADTLGNLDPPRHRQLRNIVTEAFTPRAIAQLAPRITAIVDDLLDEVIADGRMDAISQFAFPLPIRVIANMLGVPQEDQEQFWRWSFEMIGKVATPDNPEESELRHYFTEMLDKRALEPQDDLMSALLAAEADGQHLSREETLVLCETLLLAGHITTTILFAQALRCFDEHPEVFTLLRNDLSLIPGAIEEVLRYGFQVMRVPRVAREDCILSNCKIKKGQMVMAWMGSANFDEKYFPNPEQFDITRSPNPHLTFSHGVHYCLGAPLARLEGQIGLERIVQRISQIRCDPKYPLQYMGDSFGIIVSLPVLFTAEPSHETQTFPSEEKTFIPAEPTKI